jgi:transcriptional regulator with XRE-family HTH domain
MFSYDVLENWHWSIAMETKINPNTLKSLRNQHDLTQEELAGRIRCNTVQVSRWERGENRRPRKDLREKLAKALRTDWETLTRPPTEVPQDELQRIVPKEQLNIRVEKATKTALELVCLRYGVKSATVVELAPLLFLITAENSLRFRRDKLRAACALMSDAETTALSHLGKYVFYSNWDDKASDEEKSISKRDIFAETLEGWDWGIWDEENDCPYTNYLRHLADDLIEEGDAVAEISPNHGTAPDYKIALDTFREVTGIDGDTERDKLLHRKISAGYIKLRDVIVKRKELNKDEYQKWLDEALWDTSEQFSDNLNSFVLRQDLDAQKEILGHLREPRQEGE